MVPFLAQGAAQAIEDAQALADALARIRTIPEALSSYSRSRVARATRVQAEAARQGRIYHMSGPMAFARDAAMRLLGRRKAQRALRLALPRLIDPPRPGERQNEAACDQSPESAAHSKNADA